MPQDGRIKIRIKSSEVDIRVSVIPMLHGEAVAIGMRAAARLSVRAARLPEQDRLRLEALLDRLALPRRMPPVTAARLHAAMRLDKKRARRVRWVLTPRIGHASVPRPIDRRLVQAAMLEVGARL